MSFSHFRFRQSRFYGKSGSRHDASPYTNLVTGVLPALGGLQAKVASATETLLSIWAGGCSQSQSRIICDGMETSQQIDETCSDSSNGTITAPSDAKIKIFYLCLCLLLIFTYSIRYFQPLRNTPLVFALDGKDLL